MCNEIKYYSMFLYVCNDELTLLLQENISLVKQLGDLKVRVNDLCYLKNELILPQI